MSHFKKRIALMLSFIMTLSLISVTSSTAVMAVQSTHTLEHGGFTLEFRVHSSWDSGYNAEIVLTNNTSRGLY